MEDWRKKNECYPFEDSDGNLCITVKSEYESFGGEQEARLNEAKYYGIDRLIRFYGKTYNPVSTSLSQIDASDITISIPQTIDGTAAPTKLYDAASTPEHFISPRECVRMKVLVKIPKNTFDEYTVNDAFCDINKPPEGYLSAFISVENYERDIDYVTTSMEDFLPKMAKANRYMTNINIVKEIKRLKRVKNVIRRYFNLNSVTPSAVKEEECEPDVSSLMEIGFSYDYKPVFALIDGNKHTIGYDCFLEESLLNHSTTANYLIQLGNMSHALTKQLSLDFDIFEFLTTHTYPTPVLETKENTLDGLDKYDANGNLISFANLAKLITLDLDKKSCKPDETVSSENRIIINKETRNEAARAAAQTKQFIGDWRLSTEGAEELKETLGSMWEAVSDRHEAEKALKKVMNDVLEKVNWGCVLEESLQCMLEESITKFGTSVFDDPDLGQFFSADGAVELEGLCQPDDGCENELQLRVGIPAFQGITIPTNFPTTDYLAKTIDLALGQLYNVLINSFVSLIMSLLDNVCKMISSLSEGAAIGNMFTDSFTSWLSETIGIDVSLLKDGQAWQDAALSAGGAGFMGVIGNLVSKTAGSMDSSGNWVWGGSVTAAYSGTGISLNLPNPNNGMVEEMFVSQEFITNIMSGIRKGTEDLEVVLTPEEYRAVLKGAAPDDVLELAFVCLNRGNPEVFQSPEDVSDVFSALGEMVNGSHLESPITQTQVVTSVCDLGDGSNQDILRKSFLKKKDSLLSDLEIEELMSREKSRFIEKIKKMHKILKSFQDGSIFPDFPSIFGSDDSLIPEAPPVISAAMATVSEGLYSSTINNFSVSMLQYAPLWKEEVRISTSTADEEKIDYPSFAELSKKLMVNNPNTPLQSLKRKFNVDDNMTNLGYTIHDDAKGTALSVVESDIEGEPKLYEWYKGNFDAGKWTTEKFNYQGEDDAQFEQMLNDAGIRVVDLSTSVWEVVGKVLLALILGSLLIVGTIGMGAWVVAGILGTGLVWGTGLGAVIGVTSILAGLMYLSATVYGIWQLIQYWSVAEGEELTGEYVECLRDSGKITEEEYQEIVPQLDELVEKTKEAQDMLQWGEIQKIANYLEDKDNDNGPHYRVFDITTMLETPDPLNKTELILDSTVSGQWDGKDNDVFYTIASIRKTPYTSEEVNLEREDGFSEVITSFERRGVRRGAAPVKEGSMTPSEMAASSKMISIQDIYDSGTSLMEYDGVKNKITNYRMENESSLLLGRKIVEPNLLETKYSSTIDAPDKSIMEIWTSQEANNSDLQEYHLALRDIFEESWPNTSDSDIKRIYRDRWQDCMRAMAERVSNNRMYLDEYLNALELEYPKQDILGYKKVSEESIDLTSSIMKLESSIDDYCDALTPLRRSGSITGLRLMIRTFIVERVLNSLQVFDTFNTDFMTSDMFKKAVFDDIKVEMGKYQNSFETTLDGNIFSDMKETASKYFEIQGLLGNEVPELNTDKEAILEIIKMEIDDISTTIASQLKLETPYQSSTWDDFVFDFLLSEGEYVSGVELNSDGEVIGDRRFESKSVLDPFSVNTEYIGPNADDDYTYVAELLYNTTVIVRAECLGPKPTQTKEGCDDVQTVANYSKVKQLLFDNDTYQNLISYVFPLKDAATLLSTYHLSAITDPSVFQATEDGKHVTDLFAETKLSTLQTFLACLNGAGETAYIDPFLEKLKT